MNPKLDLYQILLAVEDKTITPEQALTDIIDMPSLRPEVLKSNSMPKMEVVYTDDDILECPIGIYEVFWTSGGSSLASVGCDQSGVRWFAPINWVTGSHPLIAYQHEITRMVLVR